ncbi:MAG: secretin N-terminal domain-containing protein, partial [Desulfomonilaceae bacterium]
MFRPYAIIVYSILIFQVSNLTDSPVSAEISSTVIGSSQAKFSRPQSETMRKEIRSRKVLLPEGHSKRSFQRVHEPECFEIGETTKCFFYEAIKIKNAIPSEISRVLRRLFNNQCSAISSMELTAPQDQGFIRILEDLCDRHRSQNSNAIPPSRIKHGPINAAKLKYNRNLHSGYAANGDSFDPFFEEFIDENSSKTHHDRHWEKEPVIYYDDQNSLIFVKDTQSRIRQIKEIISSLDKSSAQVRIESRIVRANKDWSRGVGILWGGRNNQFGGVKTDRSSYWGITGNQSGAPANTATGANLKQTIFVKGVQQLNSRTITSSEIPSRLAINLPANVPNIGDLMGLGLQFGLLANQYITELDVRLQIGEAQGHARTVARPSIQVSDGKNAVIKSGSVLNVATSSPLWGTNAELVDVCLKLQVTPKVLANGRIKMIISVTDNEPNVMPTTGELYLEREAHTTMTVSDGETCVIGGIIRDTSMGRREGWPGLMNLPIVGMLFSNKTKAKEI